MIDCWIGGEQGSGFVHNCPWPMLGSACPTSGEESGRIQATLKCQTPLQIRREQLEVSSTSLDGSEKSKFQIHVCWALIPTDGMRPGSNEPLETSRSYLSIANTNTLGIFANISPTLTLVWMKWSGWRILAPCGYPDAVSWDKGAVILSPMVPFAKCLEKCIQKTNVSGIYLVAAWV